ncbi:AcrR family transcriptional regulator [Lipingzhangella halophila]|uniref:AcrR family transcriptional regulator n=1 Tax=Lipingzhangella halophila TaxID=1783352 RepID=A0A7W7RHT8_9ACTN|nr:TetR family transcriptional regulator [Lipingzhangella halophila]MBB4932267.1 AcrR family transcriptional regulator [Lipingzhangella halophila]
MGRWEPDALGRLQQAALALYGEQGFDNTTVAEIAERAGLTKRTFFRYFTDKREVLFWGSQELEEGLASGVGAAPESAAPLDAVGAALEAASGFFEQRREWVVRRQRIITANPELHERELIKLASLTRAIAAALRDRGVDDPTATLTAKAGAAVFEVAFEQWTDETNQRPLQELIRGTLEEFRAVADAR